MKEFNDTGCADLDPTAHVPLSQLDFVWKLQDVCIFILHIIIYTFNSQNILLTIIG